MGSLIDCPLLDQSSRLLALAGLHPLLRLPLRPCRTLGLLRSTCCPGPYASLPVGGSHIVVRFRAKKSGTIRAELQHGGLGPFMMAASSGAKCSGAGRAKLPQSQLCGRATWCSAHTRPQLVKLGGQKPPVHLVIVPARPRARSLFSALPLESGHPTWRSPSSWRTAR